MEKLSFSKLKPYLFETLFYVSTFLVSVLFYLIFTPLINGNEHIGRGEAGKYLAICLLVILSLVLVILANHKKLDRKTIIFLMIIASYIIRLGYILYTEGVARQYDTWGVGDDGHFDYANIIYLSGKLPPNNNYQFYHPPFNAFVQSIFMKFFKVAFTFANNTIFATSVDKSLEMTNEAYFSACQTLSLLYVTIITVTASKIFKKLNIEGIGGLIGLAFIIFFPRFIQLSGQLNNDILCIMLCILAVYWAIKFYQNQTYLNIIVLAVIIGLALMTKLNGATICLPIAILMIMVLVDRLKTKEKGKIIDIFVKFAIFVVVCAPIALWFQVYAYKRFGQPFAFVFSNLNGHLSTSHVSVWNRFFMPTFSCFKKPFANAWEDYNLWDYMLKSSLFGEFSYWNGTAFACVAVIVHYLFHITFIVSLVFAFFNRKFENKRIFDLPVIVFGSIIVTLICCQIYFYIKMPYGCTMDFRYVVPLVLGYGGMVGVMQSDSKNTRLKGYKTISLVNGFFAVCLVCLTTIFYLVCV